MKESLLTHDVIEIFTQISDEIARNRDFLIELDGAMGDGDLGLTMSEGFSKVCEGIVDLGESLPGEVIGKAGFIMARSVPSTMGTLMATALMAAGKRAAGRPELTVSDLAVMGRAAVEGIMQRGKAAIGDKTILDTIGPAVAVMETLHAEQASLEAVLEQAFQAAVQGVEATRSMKSVHGRAAWYGEKSIGKQDPGATVGMIVFQALRDWSVNQG